MTRLKSCNLALLPVFLVIPLWLSPGNAQVTDWANLFGGKGQEVGSEVATDLDGNVFLAGNFESTADIGGRQLTSAGGTDVYVAKFGPTGKVEWANRLGGISTDEVGGLAVDYATGDVVVIGRFALTASVGNDSLRSVGATDIFLAKWSASGTLKWAIELGTATDDLAAGVAVDPDGNIVMTGNFAGTLQCGQTPLSSEGRDIFLARLTTNGTYQWCRRLGGSSDDSAGDIAVDDSGLIALTGAFSGTTNLGGGDLRSDGIPFDAFVAVYANDGSYRWARRIGGSGYEEGLSIAFDRFGAVVAGGYFGQFGGAVDFGGGPLASTGSADAFVAKYNASDGQYAWASKFGGIGDDRVNAVTIDDNGKIAVAGEFQSTAIFAGTSGRSGGQFDAFVAAFSSRGTALWWRSYGDLVNDKAHGIAADLQGSLYFTGFSIFRIDLGTGPLLSIGQADAFLAKLVSTDIDTATPTPTYTRTPLPPTPTWTHTRAATLTFTPTHTRVPATATHTSTRTATRPAPTSTPRPPTATSRPPTATFSPTVTRPPTSTSTATPSFTATRPVPTNTATRFAGTATRTATSTRTSTRASTPTRTRTPTLGGSPVRTNTPTRTRTATRAATVGATATRTPTRSALVRTGTPTRTASPTFTITRTRTPTRSRTPTSTPTYTRTRVVTATRTATSTRPPVGTFTPTRTRTPTIARTATPVFRPFGIRRGISLGRLGISR